MSTDLTERLCVEPPELGIAGSPALMFQPVVDLTSGQILGFEALLRWVVPGHGTVMPSAFIPWAEANGHMAALNTWVLAEACAQATRWPSRFQVAVNCSTFQLRADEAATAVTAALERSGLNPDRLMVEVPALGASEDLRTTAGAMTRLGVQLTMDDVGSDLPLLASLENFAARTIKIDGSIIAQLESPADSSSRLVVASIIDVSRSLGICTVAECVETAGQAAILKELGADVAQGYYFSRPITAEEAAALANGQPPTEFARTTSRSEDDQSIAGVEASAPEPEPTPRAVPVDPPPPPSARIQEPPPPSLPASVAIPATPPLPPLQGPAAAPAPPSTDQGPGSPARVTSSAPADPTGSLTSPSSGDVEDPPARNARLDQLIETLAATNQVLSSLVAAVDELKRSVSPLLQQRQNLASQAGSSSS